MTWIIHTGDCLAVLRGLPSESVDAIITDPPYSSGGTFLKDRNRGTAEKYVGNDVENKRVDFAGDTRDQRSYAYWCALWLAECLRIGKPGAMLAMFTDWRQLPATTDAVQSGGWSYRGVVPWSKTEAARPQKGWFRAQCEYVVLGAKGTPATYGAPDAPSMPGFMVCPVERDNEHQTQKPLEVMRWLMQIVPKGGSVLDPFSGSGTTGVAAIMEGLDFTGCEMVPHYAEVARRRIAEADPVGRQESLFGEASS